MMPHELRQQLIELDARLEKALVRNERTREQWVTHYMDTAEGAQEIHELARREGISLSEVARRRLKERLEPLVASVEEDPADALERAFKEAGDHA